MAQQTTNYNLTKPEMDDEIQNTIPALAENMDIIDGELKEQDTRIDNIVSQSGDDITEIVDARHSTVKGITFSVLKDRLEDGELDVEDLVANFNTHKSDYAHYYARQFLTMGG